MPPPQRCGATHLQRVLDAVQAVLGAVGGGIAAPPVEGDAPDLEPGRQASATDVVVSIHVQRHWGAKREGEGGGKRRKWRREEEVR